VTKEKSGGIQREGAEAQRRKGKAMSPNSHGVRVGLPSAGVWARCLSLLISASLRRCVFAFESRFNQVAPTAIFKPSLPLRRLQAHRMLRE
jgi:hypothetical protein